MMLLPTKRLVSIALRQRSLPRSPLAATLNFCTGPVDKRERDAAPTPSPLKAMLQNTALGGALLAMPKGSVFAAAAATPAPLCGPTMVTFLQTFPPLAAQACFLAPWSAMKQVEKVGDVGDLPLLPYAAMAVNGIGWVCYGALAPGPYGEPTIWVPNITAFLFGSYYWCVRSGSLPFAVPRVLFPWSSAPLTALAQCTAQVHLRQEHHGVNGPVVWRRRRRRGGDPWPG